MSKSEKIILYLIILIACVICFVLVVNKSKDVMYSCEIIGRNISGYEISEIAEYYQVEGKIVKIHKINGSILEYDLEDFIVLCSEMEIIE